MKTQKVIKNSLYMMLIIAMISFTACSGENSEQLTETPQKTKKKEVDEFTEFDEMSIFQLPSEWENQDGETVQLSDYKGDVLVTVMIYTTCKAACPRLVADMKDIYNKVGENTKKPIKYLLFSIDPKVDTPERLKEFCIENNMNNENWVFLRSTEENTREFANVLAVKYAEISPIDFSHSNIISVFDENGVMKHQMEGLAVNNEKTVQIINELATN